MRPAAGAVVVIPVALAWLSTGGSVDPVLVVLIVVTALCWVITDPGRSKRLTMLIRAWRGGRQQGGSKRPSSASDNEDGNSRDSGSPRLPSPPARDRAKSVR
jgi:hypothetical protein